jgi:hypothetical protein
MSKRQILQQIQQNRKNQNIIQYEKSESEFPKRK